MLSDFVTVAAVIILVGLIAGMIGGAIGYGATRLAMNHILRVVKIEVQAVAVSKRIMAPAEIQLRVHVPPIEPITVPIVTAPAPTHRELAERVLNVYPDTGPTDLAEIVGCAKSTAHAILSERRATQEPEASALVVDREEISTYQSRGTEPWPTNKTSSPH